MLSESHKTDVRMLPQFGPLEDSLADNSRGGDETSDYQATRQLACATIAPVLPAVVGAPFIIYILCTIALSSIF